MANPADRPERLRILLSEGSSTSARQAITALGLSGHHIEVCDPDPRCFGRFSRFVAKFHRCPGLQDDPHGYLAFVCDLLAGHSFDVLLPIHEQGFLFAKVLPALARRVGIALPSFDSYRRAHSKAGFNRVLDELKLQQPVTRFVRSAAELRAVAQTPCVIKTAIGTASRGTWIVKSAADLERALHELQAGADFDDEVLLQEFVPGPVEHAQAIFVHGRLVAFHAYRQLARGAGGGDARKESVRRPAVRGHLVQIGDRLAWHGALSVDYILREADGVPLYIDCNPRLVEPMSARLAGLDLADVLLRVSRGQDPGIAADASEGCRTHLAMQALLGCALRTGRRRDVIKECWHLLTVQGDYRGSHEELTPVRLDWPGTVPLMVTALLMLIQPNWARTLPKTGWGGHLLDAATARRIANENFPECSA